MSTDINLTFIVQALMLFITIVCITKFGWSKFLSIIEDRQTKIAEGLLSSDMLGGRVKAGNEEVTNIVHAAHVCAAALIEDANRQAGQMIESAKQVASGGELTRKAQAKQKSDMDVSAAKIVLRLETQTLALAAAGKILGREVDAERHQDILEDLAKRI